MDWYIESMDEMRRLQKVGYSTLSLSIPSDFAKDLGLRAGDNMLVREEADGTLRLIPAVSAKRVSRATIRTDQLDGEAERGEEGPRRGRRIILADCETAACRPEQERDSGGDRDRVAAARFRGQGDREDSRTDRERHHGPR